MTSRVVLALLMVLAGSHGSAQVLLNADHSSAMPAPRLSEVEFAAVGYHAVRLTSNQAESINSRAVVDADYLYVVWEDTRDGNREIYWQKFSRFGLPVTDPINISSTAGASVKPALGIDGSGNSFIVWQEDTPYGTIYGAKVDGAGTLVVPPLTLSPNLCMHPDIVVRSNGMNWIVYHRRTASDQNVYGRRSNGQFAQSCVQGLNAGTLPAFDKTPVVTEAGNGHAFLAWRDMDTWWQDGIFVSALTTVCNVYSKYLHAGGDYTRPGLGWSGAWPWMVSQRNGNVYNHHGEASVSRVNDNAGTAANPRVGDDPDYGYVVWQDSRDGNMEIYLSRAHGSTSFTDIRLTEDPASSQRPDIATYNPEPGGWWVVWQDDRDGNWEIYLSGTTITPCGGFQGLFCDDFEVGVSPLWQSLTGSQPGNCTWSVTNGTYGTVNTGTNQLCIRSVLDLSWQNFIYEVEIHSNAGMNKEVTFRSQDGLNTYALNLVGSPTNELHLNKIINGVSSRLTTIPYPTQTGEWYHLKISCIGARFTIWVDGNQVLQYADDPQTALYSGGIGLVSWTGDDGICDISFDNVSVIALRNGLDFQLDRDAWGFMNIDSEVWPWLWWPWDAKENLCRCGGLLDKRRCFPTWEVFQSAFGKEQTENGEGNRLPDAEAWWKSLQGCFNGACYGFGATTLLFLDDYHFTVPDQFPGHSNLHEIQPTDENDKPRKMLAAYHLYQWAEVQEDWGRNHRGVTPGETFDDCHQMFNDVTDNRAFLAYDNDDGQHIVNPYRCATDEQNRDKLYIHVYDNLHPDEEGVITIDRSQVPTTWSYRGITEQYGTESSFLYLTDPLSNYTDYGQLPISRGRKQSSGICRTAAASQLSEAIKIYPFGASKVLLASNLGHIGCIVDSIVNTVEDGFPIVTFEGEPGPPMGYEVPNTDWTFTLSEPLDTSISVALFADNAVIVYSRTGAAAGDVDSINYFGNDTTLCIYNPSLSERAWDVEVINVNQDSQIVCDVFNATASPGDSVYYSITPGSGIKIDNFGEFTHYALRIEIVTDLEDTVFFHNNIGLPANSTHMVIPDWRQSGDSLLILVDAEMTGVYADSMVIGNEPYCDCTGLYDLNLDGQINPVDVVYIINYVYLSNDMRIQPPACPNEAGDVNCDWVVNPVDAVIYINRVYMLNDMFCADPCGP